MIPCFCAFVYPMMSSHGGMGKLVQMGPLTALTAADFQDESGSMEELAVYSFQMFSDMSHMSHDTRPGKPTKSYGKIHHAINGKTHYFDWAIFNSFLYVYQAGYVLFRLRLAMTAVIPACPTKPGGRSQRDLFRPGTQQDPMLFLWSDSTGNHRKPITVVHGSPMFTWEKGQHRSTTKSFGLFFFPTPLPNCAPCRWLKGTGARYIKVQADLIQVSLEVNII